MSQDLSNYTVDYYKRDIRENDHEKAGLLRPDMYAAICYAYGLSFTGDEDTRREPGIIFSIGCGAGKLEKHLEDMGNKVVGVDPSPGAQMLYEGKELIPKYEGGGNTIIFCESIEHIPVKELEFILALVPIGARVIIVNWLDYFPIEGDPNGWDHITTIDDNYYSHISRGWKVITRKGSHLVMEKL